MTSITLSRFQVSRRAYGFSDAYIASLDPCPTCVPIAQHMTDTLRHMLTFTDQPTGWSFGRWRNGNNSAANLIENHAIVLEYPAGKQGALIEKLANLEWRYFIIMDENRTQTRNTVSVVFPLTAPVDAARYARIASVLAYQIDEYDVEEGSLSPTHIIHVHRTSTVAKVGGTVIDPEAFIARTKDYPAQNARKYQNRRTVRAAQVHLEPPVFTQNDDLFAWPETAKEKKARAADEVLASIGVTLR
jgi:hypothetical protein